MNKFTFDLDSLYGVLMANPFTVDGSFDCYMVNYEEDHIEIEINGDRYEITEIITEYPNEGRVTVLTREHDELDICFFKPTTFDELNFR